MSSKNITAAPQSGELDYRTYGEISTSAFASFLITAGGIFSAVVLTGTLLKGSIPTGQFIGAGMIVSIVVGLWSGLTAPIASAVTIYGGWQGLLFYNGITIVLGIMTIVGIAEIFTNKGDIY